MGLGVQVGAGPDGFVAVGGIGVAVGGWASGVGVEDAPQAMTRTYTIKAIAYLARFPIELPPIPPYRKAKLSPRRGSGKWVAGHHIRAGLGLYP